jgi:alpha-tubulin suppressor-like RCC1 family protein
VAGTPNGTPATIPLTPAAGLVFTHVAAGARHACATTSGSKTTDPVIFCWGDDTSFQMGVNGTGATASAPIPSKVGKPTAAGPTVFEAGGVTTCVLEDDGGPVAVQSWGGDAIAVGGGLGIGELWDLVGVTPTPPGPFSVGGDHGCLVDTTGKLACWGHGTQGQLGNGGLADSMTFVHVVDL